MDSLSPCSERCRSESGSLTRSPFWVMRTPLSPCATTPASDHSNVGDRMPQYDITNANGVKVDTVHASRAVLALADFLSRSVGNPTWVRQRREEIISKAHIIRATDSAVFAGTTAKPAEVAPVTLTPASLDLFLGFAEDAPNWSGSPLVTLTPAQRGNLADLKKKGLLTTWEDEDGCVFVNFTDAGIALA